MVWFISKEKKERDNWMEQLNSSKQKLYTKWLTSLSDRIKAFVRDHSHVQSLGTCSAYLLLSAVWDQNKVVLPLEGWIYTSETSLMWLQRDFV